MFELFYSEFLLEALLYENIPYVQNLVNVLQRQSSGFLVKHFWKGGK